MASSNLSYRSLEDGYIIRLHKGVQIAKSMHDFIREHTIAAGTVSAIGAIQDVELGYYHLAEKTYSRKHFPDIVELVSLSGNISWIDGKPFMHAHASISNEQCQLFGGHFFEGRVAVTAEMHLKVFSERLQRVFDEETGLNLLDI
ncbi:MAG: PPC domain-containing DNA-binding protein [Calditrichia bacterium]